MHNIAVAAGMVVAVLTEAEVSMVVVVSTEHHAVVAVFMVAAAFAVAQQCVAEAVSVVM